MAPKSQGVPLLLVNWLARLLLVGLLVARAAVRVLLLPQPRGAAAQAAALRLLA